MERKIPFGRFVLIEPRGALGGCALIAPEHVLLQRSSQTSVRDVSYLAVWSAARSSAIARELVMLSGAGTSVVGAATPEVHAILHAIAPAASLLFVGGGKCLKTVRALMRRHLDAELRATMPPAAALAAGRKVC